MHAFEDSVITRAKSLPTSWKRPTSEGIDIEHLNLHGVLLNLQDENASPCVPNRTASDLRRSLSSPASPFTKHISQPDPVALLRTGRVWSSHDGRCRARNSAGANLRRSLPQTCPFSSRLPLTTMKHPSSTTTNSTPRDAMAAWRALKGRTGVASVGSFTVVIVALLLGTQWPIASTVDALIVQATFERFPALLLPTFERFIALPSAMFERYTALLLAARPAVWPIAFASAPFWVLAVGAVVAAFLRSFFCRGTAAVVAAQREQQRDHVEEAMRAVLDYTAAEDAKPDPTDAKLPEANRVFNLLWDDTYDTPTAAYGVNPELTSALEQILCRAVRRELAQCITFTARARCIPTPPGTRGPAAPSTNTARDAARPAGGGAKRGDELVMASLRPSENTARDAARPAGGGAKRGDELVMASLRPSEKELAEHASGEQLQSKLAFVKETLRGKAPAGCACPAQVRAAEAVAEGVRKEQRTRAALMLRLVAPALPTVLYVVMLTVAQRGLMAVFHQLASWASPIEAATAGDWGLCYGEMARLGLGHLLIDVLGTVAEAYTRRAEAQLGHRIRSRVLQSMLSQDYAYFEKNSPGVLQERLNRDADQLGESLIRYPQRIFAQATQVVLHLVLVARQVPLRLFGLSVAPLVTAAGAQWWIMRYCKKAEERQRKIVEATASATSQVLREIRTVRQFVMERREADRYRRACAAKNTLLEESFAISLCIGNLVGLSIYGGLLLTLWFGIEQVTTGKMTMAVLLDSMFKLNFGVVFGMRSLIEEIPKMTKMTQPFGRICDLLEATPKIEPPMMDEKWLGDDAAAPRSHGAVAPGEQNGNRNNELGEREWSISDGAKLKPERFAGLIEFRNVHFAFPSDLRKSVLAGMSFTVRPGEKVALVGPTGCGKSSCMALLQRLYEPQSGEIRLDGHPLSEYDLHWLRSRVVIVDQNTVLMSDTIRANVTYGLPAGSVSDDEVVQALKDAMAWEFVSEMPDRLMTMVASGGGNLSGGQKQRLAIARAMVRKPDVILLDEATSALDNENEAMVQEALDALAQHGSALVIAHRLSTIKDASQIVVVDKGVVVEMGTHDELIARCGDEEQEQEDVVTAMLGVTGTRKKEGTSSRVSYRRLWDAATGTPTTRKKVTTPGVVTPSES